jgi:hypothetical protein
MAGATSPEASALRRHANNCDGSSRKSIKRVIESIHALTARSGTWRKATELVGQFLRPRDHRHTFAPGKNVSLTIRSFATRDQVR